MRSASIGQRLLSAVKYVRQGAVFADVGTDHAYLPIYLLKEGLIGRAVLSDINSGPLATARENAEEAGVPDKVTLVLADGASALADMGVTDVAIFGMGGELIADIIERAPFLKDGNIRLVLQAMSKQEELCEYLNTNGFSVIGETYTAEAGKFYRTLCAEFTGVAESLSEDFATVGFSTTPCEEIGAKIGYLRAHLASLLRAISGKRQAGLEAFADERRANAIERELARLEKEKQFTDKNGETL